ncbi:Basic amino-acid permease [Orbilia javanica]|uniref:Basic amino-acid permease n=1 Tax=Orbilia javanica TaxID=47235 RepID=A0AAN8RJV1_9PEZI
MRHNHGLIFFLALVLLWLSFAAADDEPDEKPWIFTIKHEHRKHKDLPAMHKAFEKVDAKPPYNWVFESGDETFGVYFMTVNCTEKQKTQLEKDYDHLISQAGEYKPYREALYTAFESSDYVIDQNMNQRHERLMMAQEPGEQVPTKYFYHKSQGEGITVYFIDTGINRQHPEFAEADREGRIEVLFADPFPPDPNDPGKLKLDVDSSLRFSHGSSVAGVVIGKITGLAPKAKAVMIAALDRDALSSEPLYLNALLKLHRHIKKNNSDKRVVVNISMNAGYFQEAEDPNALINDIRRGLEDVFDELAKMKNVVIVSASGVSEWSQTDVAWSWPNMRADKRDTAPNLVVVGGVDKEGKGIFQRPKAEYQQVYAPAYAVKIASNIGYQLTTGTSFSSAYAAGVLANYMSKDKQLTAEGAKDLLIKNSYPRFKDSSGEGPNVIWTGNKLKDAGWTYKEMEDAAFCKRDDKDSCKPNSSKSGGKTNSQPNSPLKTSVSSPQRDEDDDDDDDYEDDDDEDDDDEDDGDVNYISTSTVIKEVKYNVYVTVGPNGPSPTNADDEYIDPLADPKDRGSRQVKARAVAIPTQTRIPASPDTGNLAVLKTSTATDQPSPGS